MTFEKFLIIALLIYSACISTILYKTLKYNVQAQAPINQINVPPSKVEIDLTRDTSNLIVNSDEIRSLIISKVEQLTTEKMEKIASENSLVLSSSPKISTTTNLYQSRINKRFQAMIHNIQSDLRSLSPSQAGHIESLENKKRAVSHYFNDYPIGSVIAYFLSPEHLPETWQLCDGTNKTPNLNSDLDYTIGVATYSHPVHPRSQEFDINKLNDYPYLPTYYYICKVSM